MSVGQRRKTTTFVELNVMEDSKIKTDWLVNNAVVAFVGALLLDQFTQTSASDFEWFFGIVIPSLPPIANLVVAASLLVMAVALAASAAIPPLRDRALSLAAPLVPVLELLVWVAFTLGFFSAVTRLPDDHAFSAVLIISGLVFWIFLLVRFLLSFLRWAKDDTDKNDHEAG